MRGAAPVTLRELPPHKHPETTMRYLHLTPGAMEGAIRRTDVDTVLQRIFSPPSRLRLEAAVACSNEFSHSRRLCAGGELRGS